MCKDFTADVRSPLDLDQGINFSSQLLQSCQSAARSSAHSAVDKTINPVSFLENVHHQHFVREDMSDSNIGDTVNVRKY